MKRSVLLATVVLLVLVAAAACAPFLANERPLAVGTGGAWSFPAFAALRGPDFVWLAGCAVAAALLLRGWWRAGAVVVAAALVLYGNVIHVPRTGPVTVPDAAERLVHAWVTGPTNIDLLNRYASVGDAGHPLGTDELGRDVLARLLFGLRLSLLVGFSATAIAMALGVGVGALAGCGGRVGNAIGSWIIQTSLCLPAVFVIAATRSLGAISIGTVILVLALLRFGGVARLVRQECIRVRDLSFVVAARGLGLHPLKVLGRHVLPNALIPASVAAAFGVAGAILAEAGLSFLGLGVDDATPSLGRMMNDGRHAAPLASHLVILPGLILLVLVLACHVIGAAVRDRLDPRGAEATS